MSTASFLFVLVLLGTFALLARSIRIVRAGQVVLVNRLGIPHRTLRAGVHVLVPVIDNVDAEFSETSIHSSRQQVEARTSDQRPLRLALTVQYSAPLGSPDDLAGLTAQAIAAEVARHTSVDVRANDDAMLERFLRGVLDDAFRTRGMRALQVQVASVTRP